MTDISCTHCPEAFYTMCPKDFCIFHTYFGSVFSRLLVIWSLHYSRHLSLRVANLGELTGASSSQNTFHADDTTNYNRPSLISGRGACYQRPVSGPRLGAMVSAVDSLFWKRHSLGKLSVIVESMNLEFFCILVRTTYWWKLIGVWTLSLCPPHIHFVSQKWLHAYECSFEINGT